MSMFSRVIVEPAGLPASEAARYLGVSVATVRRQMYSGELPTYYCGKRRFVPVAELRRRVRVRAKRERELPRAS